MTTIKWKYQIGDNILKKNKNGDIVVNFNITNTKIKHKKITSKKDKKGFYYGNLKYYEYSCNICGANHLWIAENKIGINRCSCCAGITRIKGINTFGDLYPKYLQYFENDDAFNPKLNWKTIYPVKCPICGCKKNTLLSNLLQNKFRCDNCNCFRIKRPYLMKYLAHKKDGELAFSTNKEVLTSCPDCEYEKFMKLSNLSFQGYKCPICNDGISFGEKFIMNVLYQLNVEFIYQFSSKHFEWCEKYKYDFYIPNKSIIIETHGIQHYEDSFSRCGGRTCIEEQKNDKYKEDLAIKNGIVDYIVLDCRYSNIEWIKNSILNSSIPQLYDISLIDWEKCFSFALNNLVKDICDYWKNNDTSVAKITQYFQLSKSTIIKYLNIGTKLGWCYYNAHQIKENEKKKISIYKDGILLGTYKSLNDLSKDYKLNHNIYLSVPCISRACHNQNGKYKGFVFRFEKE